MTMVHFHLLVNHLPIFATLLAGPLLLLSMWRRDPAVLGSAVFLLVVGAAGAWAADQSGDGAEDAVRDLPGVTRELIHAHEHWADYAVWTSTLAGLAGLGALGFSIRRGETHVAAATGVLALALVADGALVMTGMAGGRIRHTEIRGESNPG